MTAMNVDNARLLYRSIRNCWITRGSALEAHERLGLITVAAGVRLCISDAHRRRCPAHSGADCFRPPCLHHDLRHHHQPRHRLRRHDSKHREPDARRAQWHVRGVWADDNFGTSTTLRIHSKAPSWDVPSVSVGAPNSTTLTLTNNRGTAGSNGEPFSAFAGVDSRRYQPRMNADISIQRRIRKGYCNGSSAWPLSSTVSGMTLAAAT